MQPQQLEQQIHDLMDRRVPLDRGPQLTAAAASDPVAAAKVRKYRRLLQGVERLAAQEQEPEFDLAARVVAQVRAESQVQPAASRAAANGRGRAFSFGPVMAASLAVTAAALLLALAPWRDQLSSQGPVIATAKSPVAASGQPNDAPAKKSEWPKKLVDGLMSGEWPEALAEATGDLPGGEGAGVLVSSSLRPIVHSVTETWNAVRRSFPGGRAERHEDRRTSGAPDSRSAEPVA